MPARRRIALCQLSLALAAALASPAAVRAAGASSLELWYETSAERWTEALPVGNGSLGAMVYGGAIRDRLQFNLDTLWKGSPHDYAHPGAAEALPELRALLFAGQQREAEQLAGKQFMSVPLGQSAYQPCGDLWIEIPGADAAEVADFRRSLDLETAVATTSFRLGGSRCTRRVLSSFPAGAIFVELTSDRPQGLEFVLRITSPHKLAESRPAGESGLELVGRVGDGSPGSPERLEDRMRFAAQVRVLETDGAVEVSPGGLRVAGATRATLALTGATNFKSPDELNDARLDRATQRIAALRGTTFAAALAEHLADYQPRFGTVSISLGPKSTDSQPAEALPTDRRLVRSRDVPDPSLAALFFQYGRYLMLASSRPGSQPANLQGIWNNQLNPPWGSKYTTNINAEMNYWPIEPAHLTECVEPLFTALGEIARSGSQTARVYYDAPGWVLHHNFDLWRGTAPINASDHGIWPTGGAWLCEHLWQRWLYGGDREFLQTTAYPLMKGSAEFHADQLVEDPREPERFLVSGPSNSPEQGGLVMGPTMDHQIIRSLFANTIAAADELGVDREFRDRLAELHTRIAPHRIGRHGQLQEWLEDVDNPSNQHRHVSHLWGVYPGDEITPDEPELFRAAQVSLDHRGDGGTGWSRAWKVNLWARFRDGDRAHRVLHDLLQLTDSPLVEYTGGGVYPNLFDSHPPFQIDGNFGAVSGICEMLVQSHRTTTDGRPRIELLPALPAAWSTGSVRGLRTRGGFELEFSWSDSRLDAVRVSNPRGGAAFVEFEDLSHSVELAPGESADLADWR
ncbi:MAG: glycoside hydrolase family 95 protein [Pirellulales bacterium]|nr:glycoside hydrolase family 95 protein [Pirellulales bacterium]